MIIPMKHVSVHQQASSSSLADPRKLGRHRCKIGMVMFVCTLLLIWCATDNVLFASDKQSTLSTEPLYLAISGRESASFRFQVNGEEFEKWNILSSSQPTITLFGFDSEHDTLYVQESIDEETWSDSFLFHFDQSSGTWKAESRSRSPSVTQSRVMLQFDSLDMLPSLEFPVSVCDAFYDLSVGGDIRLQFSYLNERNTELLLHTSVGYRNNRSITDWILEFHDIALRAGIGYQYRPLPWITFEPSIAFGVVAHILYGDIGGSGNDSLSVFFDPQVRLALECILGDRQGVQLIVSPNITWYFEKASVGQHIGIDAGVRVRW